MDSGVLLRFLSAFLWIKLTDVVSKTVLQCPDTSVDAEIGKTVILRCLTEPRMNVSDMTVEWTVNDTDHHVHAQRGGKQKLRDQMKEYRGRTSLFDNKLSEGNCSLRLTVQMSDSGRYRCSVIVEEIPSCFTYLTVNEKINSPGLINKPHDASSSDSGQTGGDGKTGNDTSSALTPPKIAAISAGVVIPIIIIIIVIAVVIWKCRKSKKEQNNQNMNEREMRTIEYSKAPQDDNV